MVKMTSNLCRRFIDQLKLPSSICYIAIGKRLSVFFSDEMCSFWIYRMQSDRQLLQALIIRFFFQHSIAENFLIENVLPAFANVSEYSENNLK